MGIASFERMAGSPYFLGVRHFLAGFSLVSLGVEVIRELAAHHEGFAGEEKHYAFWLLYKLEKGGRDWRRL